MICNTTKLGIAGLATSVLVLTTTLAQGQYVNVKVTGTAVDTAVSGYSGHAFVRAQSSTDVQGLKGIEWWESGDMPCKLTAHTTHLNKLGPKTFSDALGSCSPGNGKKVKLLGSFDYVYKVQVCTTDKRNSADNRLKGVRIWARTISRTNPVKFTDQATYQEVKHTNCAVWKPAVSCGAGKIAVGVVAHSGETNSGNNKGFTGLALVCRSVVPS